MRGRVRAALAAAVFVTTIGSGAALALPVAAASRMAASRTTAPGPIPVEPLIPKKLLRQQQITTGPSARNASPQLASSLQCNSAWNAVASPNGSSGRNVLAGLAASAPNDAWAVGFYVDGNRVYRTLVEHWDGSSWSMVATPNVGPGNNLLTAVAAIGSADVWAIGFWRPGDASTYAQPLTEHWNGNGWTVVPTPNVPNALAALYSVSGDTANDVWTVGISQAFPVQPSVGPRGHALAMHWDGSNWSIVPTATLMAPIPGPRVDLMGLNGVKVFSSTNAWAVGDGQEFNGGTSPTSVDMAFVEHWDGSSWSQVTGVPVHLNGDFLIDVQGTATDLWAVGGQNKTYGSKEDNVLTDHWNGTTWSDVMGMTPEQSANLYGLGYLAPNNIYAVGASASWDPFTNAETDHTLIEHWDGANWSLMMSMNMGVSDGLEAIAAISPGAVWAAGLSVVNAVTGQTQTLTENLCTPPVVTGVVPSSGNAGSTVTITGRGFSRAIDVEFGSTPASSFHVDSDTQITAVSPGHKAGTVDIRVTVQGTSAVASADQFTYSASRSGPGAGSGKPFPGRTGPPPPVLPQLAHLGARPRAAPIPI